jgi:hypothetical protein
MDQWQWLIGIIVVVMMLWLVWSLARNRANAPAKPDLDMPRRPASRSVEQEPAATDLTKVDADGFETKSGQLGK